MDSALITTFKEWEAPGQKLDDGAKVYLTTGDCVVQSGTQDAWQAVLMLGPTLLVEPLGIFDPTVQTWFSYENHR